jgi:hypothetical protein
MLKGQRATGRAACDSSTANLRTLRAEECLDAVRDREPSSVSERTKLRPSGQ